jgi:hypothetical protein
MDSPAHHHPMVSVRNIEIQVAMPDREEFDFKLQARDLERTTALLLRNDPLILRDEIQVI